MQVSVKMTSLVVAESEVTNTYGPLYIQVNEMTRDGQNSVAGVVSSVQ
jgi:hypothetical protein